MAADNASIMDNILAIAGAGLLWLSGESGRALVAGGLGGFVRWLSTDQRRIKTGIVGVIVGALCGYYLWPLALHVPEWLGRPVIPESPQNIAMAGFLIGTMGVSIVKIAAAYLETRKKQLIDGGGNAP